MSIFYVTGIKIELVHHIFELIMNKTIIIIIACCAIISCGSHNTGTSIHNSESIDTIQTIDTPIVCGACRTSEYFSLLEDKNVAIVANQSSLCNKTHLLDTLISSGISVIKVFCPEHGFRGNEDAGSRIDDAIDPSTGIPIISLYGSSKKPSAKQMQNIDILLFDLQDVGARFYTYISTLHYVMEACAENNIPIIILDRPNPNGHYVDGPVLDTSYSSFIGMHPVPIVHGMSIGEYGLMINGEHWLKNNITCVLQVITCSGWNHNKEYSLPVKPSPNLPNDLSISLYPSICLLEGTVVSVGRGTYKQFQIIGHPAFKDWDEAEYIFTPTPMHGALNPKLEEQTCYGFDFSDSITNFNYKPNRLNLDFVIKCYQHFPKNKSFFKSSFSLLSGGNLLQEQIKQGISEKEIRASWEPKLSEYKQIRKKYLLYEYFTNTKTN